MSGECSKNDTLERHRRELDALKNGHSELDKRTTLLESEMSGIVQTIERTGIANHRDLEKIWEKLDEFGDKFVPRWVLVLLITLAIPAFSIATYQGTKSAIEEIRIEKIAEGAAASAVRELKEKGLIKEAK